MKSNAINQFHFPIVHIICFTINIGPLLYTTHCPAAESKREPHHTEENTETSAAPTITNSTDPVTDPAYITVVSADRLPPVGTLTQIDRNEITLRGGRTLPDILELEPAVEVNRTPKTGAELQLRGFDEKSIRLLFEGIPIVEVYDGHFDITAMPVFVLASITIDKGVVSPLAGPNTTGGVLRLNVPNDCTETMDIGIYGRPLGDETALSGGRASLCLVVHKDVTLFIGIGYEQSSGYPLSRSYEETPKNAAYHETGGTRDGSDYRRTSLTLLTRYAPKRNRVLTLFVDAVHAPRGIPPFEGSGFTHYWRFTRYDTFLVGLKGELGPQTLPTSFGFKGLRAHLYTHLHRDGLSDYTDETYTSLTTNPKAWFRKSAYANESAGAEITGSWALNRGNTIDLVLRYTLDRHRQHDMLVPKSQDNPTWNQWEHYLSHTYTAALEDTQVIKNIRLNAGVGVIGMSLLAEKTQGEIHPVDNRIIPGIECRLAAEWAVTEHVRLTATGGHKVRFPMLKELFANFIGGNPNLDAEKTWMGELNFESNNLLLNGLDVVASLFGSRVQSLINKTQDAFTNIGRSVIAGVELDVRYTPIRLLLFHAGYRYLFSRDLTDDVPLNYRSPHRGVVGQRVVFDFGLTIGIKGVISSGQRGDYVDSATGKWVTTYLSPYALLNAHLRFEPKLTSLKGGYVFADGFNLADSNYAVGSFEPRAGRDVIIGIGTRF